MRNKSVVLWLCVCSLLATAAFADYRDPYVPGELNFLVDAQLIVKDVSGNGMAPTKEKSQIIGKPITSALPLSEAGKKMMETKFADAREHRTTMSAVYYFNPFTGYPHNPYLSVDQTTKCFYEAEITPSFNANEVVGFAVKVRRYSYYWPLEIEEW